LREGAWLPPFRGLGGGVAGEADSLPALSGGELMDGVRRAQIEGGMRTTCVVGVDRLGDGESGLSGGAELPVEIKLVLQNPIHPFRIAMFIAVVLLGHADRQEAIPQDGRVVMAAVLTAAIGMMDGPAIAGQLRDGHLQGLYTLGRGIALAHIPTDDATRDQVG